MRWNHPERGRLLPSEFVPLAEETGLIVAVGRHVLQESCRQARAWQGGPGGEGLAVHVNLSAVEVKDPALADERRARRSRCQRARSRACSWWRSPRASCRTPTRAPTALAELRDDGRALALDDFGTGYSSLSYLRSLPLDILKIAKPFVEGLAPRAARRTRSCA